MKKHTAATRGTVTIKINRAQAETLAAHYRGQVSSKGYMLNAPFDDVAFVEAWRKKRQLWLKMMVGSGTTRNLALANRREIDNHAGILLAIAQAKKGGRAHV